MLFSKIRTFIYITTTFITTGVLSGCGGSESPYQPNPSTGKKEAEVRYTLTGAPLIQSWACTGTVEILGYQTKTFSSTGGASVSFMLPDGEYTADIDVSCGCTLITCSGVSTQFWIPAVERSGGALGWGSPKVVIPGRAVNGFTARDSFTIKDKTLVASSKHAVGKNPTDEKSLLNALDTQAMADNLGIASIEFTLIDYTPKDEAVTCDLDHRQAYYGGYGFHNVQVTNIGGNTISGWNAYIDFGDASPTSVQWTVNADATISDTGIVISGDDVLTPGESAIFSIGGQYSGQNVIDTICY